MKFRTQITAFLALGFVLLASGMLSAQITWSDGVPFSGDSDVSTNGMLVFAFNAGGSNVTINGVPFASVDAVDGGTQLGDFFTKLGDDAAQGNLDPNGTPTGGPGTGPFDAFSGPYQNLLSSTFFGGAGADADPETDTVTLGGLQPGEDYEIQLFVYDGRNGRSGWFIELDGSPANQVFLNNDTGGNGADGLGEFAFGNFTANSETQSFDIAGFFADGTPSLGRVQINAIQLRQLTGSAPVGDIEWSTGVGFSADTDISTNGESVFAINAQGATVTINGVEFVGTPAIGGGTASGDFSTKLGDGAGPGTFDPNGTPTGGAGTGPFDALSLNYMDLVSSSWFLSGNAELNPQFDTVTLSGLTMGDDYEIQLFVYDGRNGRTDFRIELDGSSANTVFLNTDITGNSADGIGEFTLGTFTASSAVQIFDIAGFNAAGPSAGRVQINAIQLRNVSDTTVLAGDVNCDGVVDLLDVAPFVELILTGGSNPKADINGDGEVDLLDVAPFVALLLG